MKRARFKQTVDPLQETGAFIMDAGPAEEAVLRIDELEARLTPDGPFGSSADNGPPNRQVGWGC
jgi:hypothetical protein